MLETMTEYERLNLLNQYKILRDLAIARGDKDDADRYEELITIVAEGYVGEYGQLTEEFSEEFPKSESELVWNTLSMYRAIQYSYSKIDNPTISESDIRFDGFDGNEEIRYYCLCKFILFDLKRFEEQTENGRVDFNSHSRRCHIYRKMLKKWESLGKRFELSEENIKYLIS